MKTFDELWSELSEKARTRPDGSGTVKQLDAGVHAIGKKLVEEAAESWMAAEHEGRECEAAGFPLRLEETDTLDGVECDAPVQFVGQDGAGSDTDDVGDEGAETGEGEEEAAVEDVARSTYEYEADELCGERFTSQACLDGFTARAAGRPRINRTAHDVSSCPSPTKSSARSVLLRNRD